MPGPPQLAMMMTVLVSKPKTKERKSAAARPPYSSVSVLTRTPDFMLILRLENAGRLALAPRSPQQWSAARAAQKMRATHSWKNVSASRFPSSAELHWKQRIVIANFQSRPHGMSFQRELRSPASRIDTQLDKARSTNPGFVYESKYPSPGNSGNYRNWLQAWLQNPSKSAKIDKNR